MTHFGTSVSISDQSYPEWYKVGAKVGEIVNSWSGRSDLIARVNPTAGQGFAPALLNPASAVIEVNTHECFGITTTPEQVGDFTQRDTHYEFPKATGAIFHEALHARYSLWSLPTASSVLTPAEFEVLTTLEETRIERLGVTNFPKQRVFLRASALDLVVSDLPTLHERIVSIKHASKLAGLLLARVEAGVLEADEAVDVRNAIAGILGEDVLSKLREIWIRAQAHETHLDPEPLYECAREWVRIISEKQKEAGESGEGEGMVKAGEAGEGSGSGFVLTGKQLEELLGELADSVAISTGGELGDQQTSEEWAETAQQKESQARLEARHKRVSEDVFRVGEAGAKTNSQLVEKRLPTPEERVSAVKVAQMLERAKYRERSAVKTNNELPPGRLRTKALVQRSALESKGISQTSEAWRRTVRKQSDNPTLTIGVMVDISGSMSSAMNPMASTAWILSEAGRRVQARSAMVYYGSDVFPTLKPGQHLSEVHVYSAPDHTEKFTKAFEALNGKLNLLSGSGARLLVIVSDGRYTDEERQSCKALLARCQQAGVAILWLEYDQTHYFIERLVPPTAEIVSVTSRLSDTALAIGKSASKALEAVTARR